MTKFSSEYVTINVEITFLNLKNFLTKTSQLNETRFFYLDNC